MAFPDVEHGLNPEDAGILVETHVRHKTGSEPNCDFVADPVGDALPKGTAIAPEHGLKTKTGKAQSRLNALKHGATAETVVTHYENPAELEALRAELCGEFSPHTTYENELVERLVRSVVLQAG